MFILPSTVASVQLGTLYWQDSVGYIESGPPDETSSCIMKNGCKYMFYTAHAIPVNPVLLHVYTVNAYTKLYESFER